LLLGPLTGIMPPMNRKLSQDLRFLQKMALTPKMKHSIKMLSMSVTDLNDYIDAVLASNPFLKKEFNRPGGVAIYEHREVTEGKQEQDPREIILSRARMTDLDKRSMEIAEYLIYEMDENGYIKCDLEETARNLFSDAEKVQEVLEVIQGLEPPGIGAGDIRECLLLQLERAGKKDSLEHTIVSDHLSDVAVNDIAGMAKSLGADREQVQRAIQNIKKLNPRPVSSILSRPARKVVPDLIATLTNKRVRLELSRESIPQLRLYNPYENKLDVIKDPEARKFLKDNMKLANNLIDNIKRREETMCRVADYILNIQKEAMARGNHKIKTLTINSVAEALKLHPSTISRAVSNKYIQINGASYPLKSFLSHGIKKQNGEVTSKTNIKNRIFELAAREDKKKPLSDGAIMKRLEKEGVFLKRRTIAKYRETLRILPRHLRKKI